MWKNLVEQAHETKAKWAHFGDTYSKTFFQFKEANAKKFQSKALHMVTKSWTTKKS